jgi:DNA helicase II / ATP-dependent DNA helicase PcrA
VAEESIDRLLRGLTREQGEAVLSDAAPLCVLAGAGSGKTTVLTRRVARRLADGSAEPTHTMVVTFTRKAAGELRGRLHRLDVPGPIWAGTFHAAAYGQLRRHWADTRRRPPAVIDDPGRLLRRLATSPEVLAPEVLSAVVAELQWAQARLVAPESYAVAARAAGRRPPVEAAEVADMFSRYVEAKEKLGVLDLNDLLIRAAEAVESDGAVAAVTRWRIRHLFVDEFQDVNPAQWRLLRAWLGNGTDLFVVGDPRQAVYGWNGADPTLLDRLPEVLPDTTVLRLDANHRCSPQVVAAARAVLGDGARSFSPVAVGRPDGPPPVVKAFDDDGQEAAAVARWLRVMHRPGRRWSQLAVLARTNTRLALVAESLESAGIPFRVGTPPKRGGALRQAIGLLGRAPRHQRLRSALADLSTADDAGGVGLPRTLRRLADEHAFEEPGSTVDAFLRWVAATSGDTESPDDDRDSDAVELSTFHRAKGLEWEAVALIGLEDGLVPIAYATSDAALAEERRLLYVAVTRAGEDLWCSWANRRQWADRSWWCTPSPLLAGIEASALAPSPTDRYGGFATRIASLRDRLAATG